MSLTLDENSAHYQIRAFEPGKVQVNEQIFTRSIIVSPKKLITDWKPQRFNELARADLEIILEMKPGILLLGTGSVLEFPPITLYGDLLNRGIGVEIMNTSAACRTYNVLTAEDRNVIAALIIE